MRMTTMKTALKMQCKLRIRCIPRFYWRNEHLVACLHCQKSFKMANKENTGCLEGQKATNVRYFTYIAIYINNSLYLLSALISSFIFTTNTGCWFHICWILRRCSDIWHQLNPKQNGKQAVWMKNWNKNLIHMAQTDRQTAAGLSLPGWLYGTAFSTPQQTSLRFEEKINDICKREKKIWINVTKLVRKISVNPPVNDRGERKKTSVFSVYFGGRFGGLRGCCW